MTGGKWLAVGALGLVVLVALLLYQMHAPEATAAVKTAAPPPAAEAAPETARAAATAKALAKVAAEVQPEQPSGKLSAASDEFDRVFSDAVPHVVMRAMMRNCYKGGLHTRDRNEALTVDFKEHIRHGDVTFTDVTVNQAQSNLDDDELQACFLAQFKTVKWHDDRLPDYDAPDEFTINPERGGKKFLDEEINYVGADAPPNTPHGPGRRHANADR